VKARLLPVLAPLALALGGCTYAPSIHAPRVVAPHELVLTYEDGYVLSAEGRTVAKAYAYEGLTDYVHCVPRAREHAIDAESDGSAAVPLQITGGVLAFGGLGGLSGLAYLDKNGGVAAGLLLGGLGMQIIGLALVAGGAKAKVAANGHAVDAMNYYNDAVGSRGRRCEPEPPPIGRRSW
jgi:hypothetical protein